MSALFAQIYFIPAWNDFFEITLLTGLLLTIILALFYLFNIWKWNYQCRKALTLLHWIKSIIVSIILLCSIPAISIFSLLASGSGFLSFPDIKVIELDGETLYLYSQGQCLLDGDACKPGCYGTRIYLKNHYLPVMHSAKSVEFRVGNIQLIDGRLIVKASDDCERDVGKKIFIDL